MSQGSRVTVRDDLAEAHRLAWEHLAEPGSWWSGAERVELAGTALLAIADPDPLPPWVGVTSTDRLGPDLARAGRRPRRRLPARSPRRHDDRSRCIAPRPTSSASSRTSSSARSCRRSPPWPTSAATSASPVPPLPAPVDGAPTGERPERLAQPQFNWVPVAEPADQVAAVVQAYTAVPGEQRNTWRMAGGAVHARGRDGRSRLARRPGGLSRAQMELVAARLTRLRDCFY